MFALRGNGHCLGEIIVSHGLAKRVISYIYSTAIERFGDCAGGYSGQKTYHT